MPAGSRSRFKPLTWLLFLGVVFLGSVSSPLTAAHKVRVIGVSHEDQPRVERILQSVRSQPWRLLNVDALLSAIKEEPSVAEVHYEGNIFGRSVLRVESRVPVAVVAGRSKLLMDKEGQIFPGRTILSGLPTVNLQESVLTGLSTVTHGYDLGGVALTCRLLRDRLPNYAWTVELDQRSVLFLTSSTGTRVILGPPEKLEAKIDKLAAIYASSPAFAKVKEINLVVPSQAVFTP